MGMRWDLSLAFLTASVAAVGGCRHLAGPHTATTGEPSATTIAIQPLGPASELVQPVRDALRRRFRLTVLVLSQIPLPTTAFTKARSRYRADKLLDFLARRVAPAHRSIVGLTRADISTTKGAHADWGVFGLGQMGGRSCVMSSFRLRKGASQAVLAARLAKVGVHEVGHTLGLPHCPTDRCVMSDAQGTIRTVDREGEAFCRSCVVRLGRWART